MLWGVVLLLDVLERRAGWRGALGAGALFGAAATMRTEALVYLAVAAGLACLVIAGARAALGRPIGIGVAALARRRRCCSWPTGCSSSATIGTDVRGTRAVGTASAAGAVGERTRRAKRSPRRWARVLGSDIVGRDRRRRRRGQRASPSARGASPAPIGAAPCSAPCCSPSARSCTSCASCRARVRARACSSRHRSRPSGCARVAQPPLRLPAAIACRCAADGVVRAVLGRCGSAVGRAVHPHVGHAAGDRRCVALAGDAPARARGVVVLAAVITACRGRVAVGAIEHGRRRHGDDRRPSRSDADLRARPTCCARRARSTTPTASG